MIDLGLPRNIDPDVVDVPGVALLDLETISVHAPLPELQATDEAREIISAAVAEFRADQQAAAVTPAVVAFRAHVLGLVEAEIERLRRRDELTPATERAMRHLASVLVHTPSTRAKAFAAAGEADSFTDALAHRLRHRGRDGGDRCRTRTAPSSQADPLGPPPSRRSGETGRHAAPEAR